MNLMELVGIRSDTKRGRETYVRRAKANMFSFRLLTKAVSFNRLHWPQGSHESDCTVSTPVDFGQLLR